MAIDEWDVSASVHAAECRMREDFRKDLADMFRQLRAKRKQADYEFSRTHDYAFIAEKLAYRALMNEIARVGKKYKL